MKTPKLLMTLGLPLGLVATALAQTDAPQAGPRPGHRPPPPLMRALDADHDGVISAGEIASAASALRLLDTNADGTVSAEELHPPRTADAPARTDRPSPSTASADTRPVPPLLLALDTNRNGALEADEVAHAPTRLAALDADHDGRLTAAEIRPVGAPRPPRQ